MCYNFTERKETGESMKKRVSIFLVMTMLLTMLAAVSACKSEETTKKKKKTTKKTKETVETTDPDDTETEPADSSTDTPTTETPESSDASDPTDTSDSSDMSFGKDQNPSTHGPEGEILQIGPHEIPEYEYHQVSVEEQELVNSEGLVVKITGYKLGNGTDRTFQLNVDNQTGHPVKMMSEFFAVNGFELSGFFVGEFEDQTNTDTEFEFFMTLGTDIGDWDPRTVDFRFSVEYTDTEATYKTEPVRIVTSAYEEGNEPQYDFSYGATLFDDGTMKVVAIDFGSDNWGGNELVLYIENNRDTTMLFQKDLLRVNGIDISELLYKFIQPHSKAIAYITFFESDLEEADITKIETITLSILIQEDGNYKDKIIGDPVTIEVG